MSQKEYVVVIDGGGTKSQLDLYDHKQQNILSLKGAFANFSVNPEESTQNLQELLNLASQKIAIDEWKMIVLGISGIQTYPFVDQLRSSFEEKYKVKTMILSDIQLAQRAYLHENGVLAIAGTGSVAIGKKDHLSIMVGGWGHILGDQGSAYSVSIRYLKQLIQMHDKGECLRMIDQNILSLLEITDVTLIKSLVYSGSKDKVASISKLLSQYTHEASVYKIFEEEAIEFSKQVEVLIQRLGLANPIRITLIGSMFDHQKIFKDTFLETFENKGYHLQTSEENQSVTIGGYYLSQEAD